MQQPALTDEVIYAIFRSAIIEGSPEAWEALHQQYFRMLIGWARCECQRRACLEAPEDIAAQAFARAWAALSAADFSQFPTISSLLGYLRQCVNAAVIDAVRSMNTRVRLVQLLPLPDVVSLEQQVLGQAIGTEMWRLIESLDLDAQEWIVLHASYVLGMPPRQILHEYRSQFTSVQAIYTVKRNLLARLARIEPLRRLHAEL